MYNPPPLGTKGEDITGKGPPAIGLFRGTSHGPPTNVRSLQGKWEPVSRPEASARKE
jgi:hypothetical protein